MQNAECEERKKAGCLATSSLMLTLSNAERFQFCILHSAFRILHCLSHTPTGCQIVLISREATIIIGVSTIIIFWV
jgi:hypothetical protein